MKVVHFHHINNFYFFWKISCSYGNLKVIEKGAKLELEPFSNLNFHFKIQAEFENGSIEKVIDLKKWSNFYFWTFSSCYGNCGVI